MTIDQQVDDGEMLLAYAIANKLAVPAGVDAVLWAARGNIATIQAPGHADRIAFLQALVAMTAAVPASAADLRSSSIRRLRVTPRINDALSLMEYAAANAKKVDDDNRKELLESSDAV